MLLSRSEMAANSPTRVLMLVRGWWLLVCWWVRVCCCWLTVRGRVGG